MCTLSDPIGLFALLLNACSLLLGARTVPHESTLQTVSQASLHGASAAAPNTAPPATRTPSRTVCTGPRSTARALLAGRPR
eukprot:558464-Pleurochrysis_carterae.AAC.1